MKLISVFLLAMFSVVSVYAKRPESRVIRYRTDRELKKHNINDLLKLSLEHSAFRHKVIAENIANISTPGYKAREVPAPNKLSDLIGTNGSRHRFFMANTSSRHMRRSQGKRGKFRSYKLKDPYETKKNGNNVSMIQQNSKALENKTNYLTALRSYTALNSLFGTITR